MVLLVAEDGEGTIELLQEEKPDHLVIEGHLREGDFVGSGSINGW